MRIKGKTPGMAGLSKLSFKHSEALQHDGPRQERHMDGMRSGLTVVFVGFFVGVAIASIFAPNAAELLTRLLPGLMLIMGYYFGWKR